jgi:hypothetical protein
MNENIPLRKLSTDVANTRVDAEKCRSNSTSKVLHAFRSMHAQTELDIMNDKVYEKIFIEQQRTSRELRTAIDSGPFGGLQGKPVDVLWRLYAGEEITNISEQTLQLAQAIAMAIQGSKGDELWCMISTQASEFYVRGKTGMTKVQSGVHTLREYNFHEAGKHAGRCAVDDMDQRILKKVWRYRFPSEAVPLNDKDKLSNLVHNRFKNLSPELAATPINVQAQSTTIDPVVVTLYLYKDIFAAFDEKTSGKTYVTVEGIYILPKCASCDPLIILKSIAENNPTASTMILNCFSHMHHVLGVESCSWDRELFRELFIGTQFSNLYTAVDTPARGRVVVCLVFVYLVCVCKYLLGHSRVSQPLNLRLCLFRHFGFLTSPYACPTCRGLRLNSCRRFRRFTPDSPPIPWAHLLHLPASLRPPLYTST